MRLLLAAILAACATLFRANHPVRIQRAAVQDAHQGRCHRHVRLLAGPPKGVFDYASLHIQRLAHFLDSENPRISAIASKTAPSGKPSTALSVVEQPSRSQGRPATDVIELVTTYERGVLRQRTHANHQCATRLAVSKRPGRRRFLAAESGRRRIRISFGPHQAGIRRIHRWSYLFPEQRQGTRTGNASSPHGRRDVRIPLRRRARHQIARAQVAPTHGIQWHGSCSPDKKAAPVARSETSKKLARLGASGPSQVSQKAGQ